jgi:hypothetical protein
MVWHTLKLVILGGKLTSVKKIIAGGHTTVHGLPIFKWYGMSSCDL